MKCVACVEVEPNLVGPTMYNNIVLTVILIQFPCIDLLLKLIITLDGGYCPQSHPFQYDGGRFCCASNRDSHNGPLDAISYMYWNYEYDEYMHSEGCLNQEQPEYTCNDVQQPCRNYKSKIRSQSSNYS